MFLKLLSLFAPVYESLKDYRLRLPILGVEVNGIESSGLAIEMPTGFNTFLERLEGFGGMKRVTAIDISAIAIKEFSGNQPIFFHGHL
jgi:hypothetical protein